MQEEGTTKIEEEKENLRERGKNRKRIIFWVICALLLVYTIPSLYCGLTVRKYEIQDERI